MDAFTISETNVSDPAPLSENEKRPEQQENRFQKAIAAWRAIDLSQLMTQLDTTASEILNNQKSAIVERKDVAQKTKEFRKLDDNEKLSEYKSLLKSYQSFVDLLTNHGKTSSSGFMQLYTSLSDAPDPFPLLEASVESLVALDETLPRLTTENEQLRKRVNQLTSQLDDTEQKLQKEASARKEAESGSGSRAEEIESSWQKALEEKESNWSAKEKTLEEKVENQDRLFKELKANYEVSQRLGQSADDSSILKASTAELEIVTAELDRTSARLAEMQGRNEQLRIELAQITSQAQSTDEGDTVLRLQNENAALLRKLDTARYDKDAERREHDTKVRQAERQRMSATQEIGELKLRLQKQADYEEIKRELHMMRTIELVPGDDDEDTHEQQVNGEAPPDKKDSLEQLLLARNKKLSSELTLLRVAHQDIQEQLDHMKTELVETKSELEKSQQLSTQLENDLVHVQEEAQHALPSSGMSMAGTYISRYPGSSRRGRSSPTSSIISGFDGQRHLGETPLAALRSGEPVGGGSGILPMVQAQRDRFKKKNSQLEEELSKTYATVTSLRQEVASLQKDNLNLYEKTRYVSTYNRGGTANTSSSMAFAQAPTHTAVYAGPESDDAHDRWKAKYEANISPFAAFRGKEATRAYNRMSIPERMVFSASRIIMATRTSRNSFAGYCVALHVILFLMLYWLTTASSVASHSSGSASHLLVPGEASRPR